MKKTNKFLACTSALFAMLLVACGQTGTSSKENKSSETPSSSVADSSAPVSSSVAPASSSQTPTSSTPASSSSKEVHVCHHTCPKCGGCQDETCNDPLCADKCTCEKDPEPTVVDVHWDANDQINLEAENGTVTGTMTGTDPGDSFIGERASDNPAHPTSGGKVVFCWAAQGNKVTWKINMPEAAQNAVFTLWTTCAFSQQSSGLGFKVNGKSLRWDESTVNGQGNSGKWYYWNEIHTTGDLVKGENTLVIENLSGESWNLDNLVISKSSTPAHVCGHVCDICGKCTDATCADPRCAEKCQGHQALSFGESGRLRFEGENYTNMAKGEVSCNESAGASGGKIIEDFSYGDEIDYEIILDKTYENVHLEIMYGLGQNNNENGAIELYVNDERVHGKGWTEATHPANDNIGMEVTGWACDTLGESNEFNLKAGKNVIEICCPYGSYTNFDYFELVLKDAPTPVDDTVKFDENDEILLEAEDGEITGTMTGTDPGDAFIGERASDNPDHATSGGKVVFCWAAQGNKVTWKFKLAEAVEYTELTLWTTCAFTQNSSGLGIKVNGESKSWNEGSVNGKGNENKWYFWNKITTSTELVKGENEIVIENLSGESWNLDCLIIKKAEKPTPVETFVNGIYRMEVEDGVLSGGASIFSQGEGEELSGGKGVGDFNGAACVTLKVVSDKERKVTADIRYALGMCNSQNQAVELYVNGTKIKGAIDNIGTDDANGWHTWDIGTSKEFVLNQGENTVELKAPYGSYANLDYIEFKETALPKNFVNGVYRLEVEDGELSGCAISTQQEGEELSGGKGVGDFNFAAGSCVTLKAISDKARNVVCDIRYALGICSSQNQAVELYVNGTKIKGQIDNIGTDDANGWHTWEIGTSRTFRLNEGENTIELKAPFGSYTNLDYIELKEDNETLFFTNDTCRYEAELGVLGGTAEAAVNANCSNGGCVESFSFDGGSSITFSVKVLETVTVKAVISYAMGICSSENQAVELYVDGTKINGQIDNIGTNDVTGWSTYVTGDSKNFELTAGTHTIVLKGPFGTYANIDYMDLVKVAA